MNHNKIITTLMCMNDLLRLSIHHIWLNKITAKYLILESWWQYNHLNVDSANVEEIQKYLRRIHNLFITNKLSLLLEALSDCDNFIVIAILYNNDVLTWDYKNNNKYQVAMSQSNKQFQGKGVNIFVQDRFITWD